MPSYCRVFRPDRCLMYLSSLYLHDIGLVRELQAILSLYLGVLLAGLSMGFSAVALPDIKEEMRYRVFSEYDDTSTYRYFRRNSSYSIIPSIKASEEELSWFGKE